MEQNIDVANCGIANLYAFRDEVIRNKNIKYLLTMTVSQKKH